MKVGNKVININNVTVLDLENNWIYFNNDLYISCTEEEAEKLASILIRQLNIEE